MRMKNIFTRFKIYIVHTNKIMTGMMQTIILQPAEYKDGQQSLCLRFLVCILSLFQDLLINGGQEKKAQQTLHLQASCLCKADMESVLRKLVKEEVASALKKKNDDFSSSSSVTPRQVVPKQDNVASTTTHSTNKNSRLAPVRTRLNGLLTKITKKSGSSLSHLKKEQRIQVRNEPYFFVRNC